MTRTNKHKCPAKLWRKFKWVGRAVYNEVYGNMTRRPEIFLRHIASLLPKKDWEVLCHNTACQAAWAAEEATKKIAA